MNLAIDAALAGMRHASDQVQRSARRLASVTSPEVADSVSLSDELVGLIAAKNAFAVSAKVVKAAAEMEERVIDLLA